MKYAQDYLSDTATGENRGGFNARLYGESRNKTMQGMRPGPYWAQRSQGWDMADKLIREGKIFSKKNGIEFKCSPDGGQWCCVGPDFVNLQESDNYTFAGTREEAIDAFMELSND